MDEKQKEATNRIFQSLMLKKPIDQEDIYQAAGIPIPPDLVKWRRIDNLEQTVKNQQMIIDKLKLDFEAANGRIKTLESTICIV